MARNLNVSISYIADANDITEETTIISDHRAFDERGKATIISIADLETRRSRVAVFDIPDEDELKPFAKTTCKSRTNQL